MIGFMPCQGDPALHTALAREHYERAMQQYEHPNGHEHVHRLLAEQQFEHEPVSSGAEESAKAPASVGTSEGQASPGSAASAPATAAADEAPLPAVAPAGVAPPIGAPSQLGNVKPAGSVAEEALTPSAPSSAPFSAVEASASTTSSSSEEPLGSAPPAPLSLPEIAEAYGVKLYPLVEFQVGTNPPRTIRRLVTPEQWQLEQAGKVVATRMQVPLKHAWAISIHKSQGMTLPCAELDLAHCFDDGMACARPPHPATFLAPRLSAATRSASRMQAEARVPLPIFRRGPLARHLAPVHTPRLI